MIPESLNSSLAISFPPRLDPQQVLMLLALYYMGADVKEVSFPKFRAFIFDGDWSGGRQAALKELVDLGLIKSFLRQEKYKRRYLMLSSDAIDLLDNRLS